MGINPTRDGIIRVCRMMGGYKLENERKSGRAGGRHLCKQQPGYVEIAGDIIPALIDEIPVLRCSLFCEERP